jgi:hypothetical protein
MRRISFLAHYIWLRVMDCVCWTLGHKLASFPKGRFCRRCYRVEGVDIREGTCTMGRFVSWLRQG